MLEIIKNKAKEITSNLLSSNNMVVYRGIENEDFNNIDLQELFNKKPTKGWMDLCNSNRRLISYEEFLYFYKFIIDEYDNVYIINNNITFNTLFKLNFVIYLFIKIIITLPIP